MSAEVRQGLGTLGEDGRHGGDEVGRAGDAVGVAGDIDAQGFQILSQLRAIFPQVVSLMMNEVTLQTFSGFCVAGTPCFIRQLPYLTSEEHALFLRLAAGNIRLEQERISHAYALEHIYRALNN